MADTTNILARVPAHANNLVKRVIDAGKAFGKARATLGSALYALAKAEVAEGLGMDFDTFALAIAREAGFDLSRSTLRNAIRIGTVREAAPDAVKGLGDTVVLRIAESLGGDADDPESVREFAQAVKAEGGTTEAVKSVRAARKGGSSHIDREAEAVRKAAEAIAKVWKHDGIGQTHALASVARTLGLVGVAEMLDMGREAIELAAVRKAAGHVEMAAPRKKARPSAEAVAKAAVRMAEADRKAEAAFNEAAEAEESARAERKIAKGK